MKLQISLSTRKSSSNLEVRNFIRNYLGKVTYGNRETYKASPKHRITGEWLSFNDWKAERVSSWKFTLVKTPIPDIEIEIPDWSINHFLGLDRWTQDGVNKKSKLAKTLNVLLKQLGWFVRRVSKTLNGLDVYLSPLEYQTEVLPPYIYHFSALHNKERILRKGILPRKGRYEQDFMYPPRIHALKVYNLSEIQQLADSIFTHGASSEDYYNGNVDLFPIVVFKIDTTKLRKGTVFYRDPFVKDGLWTYTHIPPNTLSIQYEDIEPEET